MERNLILISTSAIIAIFFQVWFYIFFLYYFVILLIFILLLFKSYNNFIYNVPIISCRSCLSSLHKIYVPILMHKSPSGTDNCPTSSLKKG